MKKIVALLLALCMVFSLCACGGSSAASTDAAAGSAAAGSGETAAEAPASGDVTTVSIQFPFPEESASGALKVLDMIEQDSGGRIKFETYFSFSFVDAGDVIDALKTNQLDMLGFNPFEHPAEMPLNGALMSLPLYNFPNWTASTQIYLKNLYASQDMMDEFTNNGMVFYAGYMCPGYNFYSTKEITDTTPAAFNGLTVMCDQAQMASFISENKGGTMSAFPTDYLSNLQNGVADALVQHVNCAYVFGCTDYIKSAMFFGEGGFYNVPLTFAFSEIFWNNLDPELQEVFKNHANDFSYECQMADEALYNNAAYPALTEKAQVIVLDDAQIAEWQDAIAPIIDKALTDIEKDSPNAMTVYNQVKEDIANYSADTFEIGNNNFGIAATWGK